MLSRGMTPGRTRATATGCIYLKFHANDTPGATGPVLFAPGAGFTGQTQQVQDAFHPPSPRQLPPTHDLNDSVGLVLEDNAQRILVVVDPTYSGDREDNSSGRGAQPPNVQHSR